jgi:hypothetical protein
VPEPPIPPRFQAIAHVVGEQVIVFGGQDVSGVVTESRLDGAVWDGSTNTWHAMPPSPLGERTMPTVAGTGRGLVVVGGFDRWRKQLADGALFDVATRAWRPLPALPVRPRTQPSVAVDGATVALFGGVASRRGGDDMENEHFADGLVVDTARAELRAIPAGPLAGRLFASVHLREGRLLVLGGSMIDGIETRRYTDGAVFELAKGTWSKVEPGGLAGRGALEAVPFGAGLVVAGRDAARGRGAIAAIFDAGAATFTQVPGTERLDLGTDCTRLFAHGERVLWFNSGMKLADDEHRAWWLDPQGRGWQQIELPATVRPRQAHTMCRSADGRDVVLFGGNHEIGLTIVDGPPPKAGPARPALPEAEADGLHFDLATGAVAPIPAGPLAPRARPLLAITRDRLLVLFGDLSHKTLMPDGAVYRLR